MTLTMMRRMITIMMIVTTLHVEQNDIPDEHDVGIFTHSLSRSHSVSLSVAL